jgi:ribosomal protein S18 acetylase RimI-like enzyme
MDINNIEVRLVKSWSDKEIIQLYEAGGWWKTYYNPSGLKHLIKGSFAFAVAIDMKKEKAIGMGRVISDGVSDAYLQDIVILPEYRNKGIGNKIIGTLLDYLQSKKILWIALIAEPGQDRFYSNIGFKKMNNYIPMKYNGD